MMMRVMIAMAMMMMIIMIMAMIVVPYFELWCRVVQAGYVYYRVSQKNAT